MCEAFLYPGIDGMSQTAMDGGAPIAVSLIKSYD